MAKAKTAAKTSRKQKMVKVRAAVVLKKNGEESQLQADWNESQHNANLVLK